MKNKQLGAAVLAILLFLCGAAAGVLGDRYYSMKVVRAHPTTDTLRARYVDEMKSRLHLTPDQVRRLDVILDQTHDKFRAFREEHRAEFERIVQDQIASVRTLLTPEQIPEYDKLVSERQQHGNRREPPPR
jgi:hypothetical protein